MSGVRLIRPADRGAGPSTPGMTREEAIASEGMWAGLVRTQAGMVSAWHHHAAYETSIYVVSGELRMEFGPGGAQTIVAGPGDFLHVEPHAVHRESNPGEEESQIIVVRAGSGEAVVNLEGPEPAA